MSGDRETVALAGLAQHKVGILCQLASADPSGTLKRLDVLLPAREREIPLAHSLERHAHDAASPRGRCLRWKIKVNGPEVLFHLDGDNALNGVNQALKSLFLGFALRHGPWHIETLRDKASIYIVGFHGYAEVPSALVGNGSGLRAVKCVDGPIIAHIVRIGRNL